QSPRDARGSRLEAPRVASKAPASRLRTAPAGRLEAGAARVASRERAPAVASKAPASRLEDASESPRDPASRLEAAPASPPEGASESPRGRPRDRLPVTGTATQSAVQEDVIVADPSSAVREDSVVADPSSAVREDAAAAAPRESSLRRPTKTRGSSMPASGKDPAGGSEVPTDLPQDADAGVRRRDADTALAGARGLAEELEEGQKAEGEKGREEAGGVMGKPEAEEPMQSVAADVAQSATEATSSMATEKAKLEERAPERLAEDTEAPAQEAAQAEEAGDAQDSSEESSEESSDEEGEPQQEGGGETQEADGGGEDEDAWDCGICGTENDGSADVCTVCRRHR
ncbi:hypothetical protein CYMTET_31635, partial [Cymbomonas tetramitiformis]